MTVSVSLTLLNLAINIAIELALTALNLASYNVSLTLTDIVYAVHLRLLLVGLPCSPGFI